MSGNQYVYVVEERGQQVLTSAVTLVTKNRRNALGALTRLREKWQSKGYQVCDQHSVKYGTYHQHVSPAQPACTVEYRNLIKHDHRVVVVVTVWVIKWAKDEMPQRVRGTNSIYAPERSYL
jgi:hypothetical protein